MDCPIRSLSLSPKAECAVIKYLHTPQGPHFVEIMTVFDVEKNFDRVIIAFPVQGNVTLEMCLETAKQSCDNHNRNLLAF